MPFIDELLANINSIICDLQPQQVRKTDQTWRLYMAITLVLFQVHTFYEAVGYMIAASTDEQQQEQLIEKYMLLPNQVWDDIITQVRV